MSNADNVIKKRRKAGEKPAFTETPKVDYSVSSTLIEANQSRKSTCVAYILWLFGGWFGLHHIYLRRDRHAFLIWSTAAGYLGCGLLRDLWRIPDYVQDANEDPEYMEKFIDTKKKEKKVDPIILVSVNNLCTFDPCSLLSDFFVISEQWLLATFGDGFFKWLYQGKLFLESTYSFLSSLYLLQLL